MALCHVSECGFASCCHRFLSPQLTSLRWKHYRTSVLSKELVISLGPGVWIQLAQLKGPACAFHSGIWFTLHADVSAPGALHISPAGFPALWSQSWSLPGTGLVQQPEGLKSDIGAFLQAKVLQPPLPPPSRGNLSRQQTKSHKDSPKRFRVTRNKYRQRAFEQKCTETWPPEHVRTCQLMA